MPDYEEGIGRLGRGDHGITVRQRGREGLLAEHRQAGLQSRYDLARCADSGVQTKTASTPGQRNANSSSVVNYILRESGPGARVEVAADKKPCGR